MPEWELANRMVGDSNLPQEYLELVIEGILQGLENMSHIKISSAAGEIIETIANKNEAEIKSVFIYKF